ncbi:RrF2 family transcriptional regulator [Niabella ginsengisoli]|uniref:Rrf2 family transcriptional regulator n=1 Tax=Niabella ginsengisoli TaxID=522298 RepID=A0ABS9SKD2_9BACT|nr:Rrf2 family transcriptional regulator [Niabella ginsengisoli]MCH5598802.1 Rrf2 family transcriptional regulator [Niabella ginsengisoli]
MKITAQEEYGLRILIRIASCEDRDGMSIPQLSETEQLSQHYIAKLTRLLRMSGFIRSTPGNKGGYIVAQKPSEIVIKNVLEALGTPLDKEFTDENGAVMRFCTSSVDCSSRSLWQMIQLTVNNLLERITLEDLVSQNDSKNTIFDALSPEFLNKL